MPGDIKAPAAFGPIFKGWCPRCDSIDVHPQFREAGTAVLYPELAGENPGLDGFNRIECRCGACNAVWACQPDRRASDVEKELKCRFEYRAPNEDRKVKHGTARRSFLACADELMVVCPESRERDIAIMKLKEAMFWANASIARRTP